MQFLVRPLIFLAALLTLHVLGTSLNYFVTGNFTGTLSGSVGPETPSPTPTSPPNYGFRE